MLWGVDRTKEYYGVTYTSNMASLILPTTLNFQLWRHLHFYYGVTYTSNMASLNFQLWRQLNFYYGINNISTVTFTTASFAPPR